MKSIEVNSPAASASLAAELDAFIYDPDRIRKCVCIGFCGRSGSFLLQSLFDGHADVMVAPPQSMMHETALVYKNTLATLDAMARKAARLDVDTVAGVVLAEYHAVAQSDQISSPAMQARFLTCLARLIAGYAKGSLTWPFFIRATFIAYSFAHGRQPPVGEPLIVLQQHNNRSITPLMLQGFAQVYFLVAVRNPVKSIDSFIRHFAIERPWDDLELQDHFQVTSYILAGKFRFGIDCIALPQHLDLVRDKAPTCVAVRFEDMHFATEALTHRLAALIGIAWDAAMLSSTAHGSEYAFPKKTDDGQITEVTGVGREGARDLSYWGFSRFDAFRLEAVFHQLYVAWDYPSRRLPGGGSTRKLLLALTLWLPLNSEVIGWKKSWVGERLASWPARRQTLSRIWHGYRQLRRFLWNSFEKLETGATKPIALLKTDIE